MISFPHRDDAAALFSQRPNDQSDLAFHFPDRDVAFLIIISVIPPREMKRFKKFSRVIKV
jgi:hypothetical protein